METLQLWLQQHCNLNYSIEELAELTELDLSNKKLASIPKEIGNLNKLRWLSLSCNQLTSLPPELGNLSRLIGLYLGGNKLIINKKHVQLIELLDEQEVKYTLADDTLLTDLLL